jgi:hypothetical protein
MEQVPFDIFKIQTPARCLISGPSMAGKSRLIQKIVKYRREIFANGTFSRIIYCYNGLASQEIDDYLKELEINCNYIGI